MREATLPGSVTGKLGGPSQRRLSSSITSAVLRAVLFCPYSYLWFCQMLKNIKDIVL